MHGIIGESDIWQFALKMQFVRFLFGDFSDVYIERKPCLQLKWHTLIWR